MTVAPHTRIFEPLSGTIEQPEFYHDIGLRSGLEIHQQLYTEKKLFCHCPAGIYVTDHDAVILRHMRPTLSELGEYDGTALMEFKTRKEIVYLLNRKNVCTYEMDDTPPFIMNGQALDIAIEISQLLGCQLVGEIHVSRKQYLDGSIPTGFQRTAIVGVSGSVPFRGRDIGIVQLAIEEDSCREVSDVGHRVTFRTDRLSMPLVETVTAPDMRTPEEVAAVCATLSRLVRVTGKVRRGIGAAREDVNVSVTGGTRVEIKGVSRIPLIPQLVHNEALRQQRLLGIREHLLNLGLSRDNLDRGTYRADTQFVSSASPALRQAATAGQSIRVQVIRGARRVLRAQMQPGILFAQELSGRVRVIACLDQPVNLFVRDEEHGFGLGRHRWTGGDEALRGPSPEEWTRLAEQVGASEEDGLVLVYGPEDDTGTAAQEIRDRFYEALDGVPNETRMPFPGGTTDFERILPGPNRMYPDTDLPPIPLEDERVKQIREALPDLPWVREKRLVEMGLSHPVARAMSLSPQFYLLESLDSPANGRRLVRTLAWVLTDLNTSLRRRGVPVGALSDADVSAVLEAHTEQRVAREGLPLLVERLARVRAAETDTTHPTTPAVAVQSILDEEFPNIIVEDSAAPKSATIEVLLEPCRDMLFRGETARNRALMGRAMRHYRGWIEGRRVCEAVAEWCLAHPEWAKADAPRRVRGGGRQ